jgi:hypothetical protein
MTGAKIASDAEIAAREDASPTTGKDANALSAARQEMKGTTFSTIN